MKGQYTAIYNPQFYPYANSVKHGVLTVMISFFNLLPIQRNYRSLFWYKPKKICYHSFSDSCYYLQSLYDWEIRY